MSVGKNGVGGWNGRGGMAVDTRSTQVGQQTAPLPRVRSAGQEPSCPGAQDGEPWLCAHGPELLAVAQLLLTSSLSQPTFTSRLTLLHGFSILNDLVLKLHIHLQQPQIAPARVPYSAFLVVFPLL